MKQSGGDIIVTQHGGLGLITLNRAPALNALTLSMIEEMLDALLRWRGAASIAHVAIRSAGGKAFCAGGDIRYLYEQGVAARRGDAELPVEFFRQEYRLNGLIGTYPKPVVALIDGIVMGGGAGIAINGRYRLAGADLRLAMPEVGIGLFPDVGATYFLPRLPGRTGTFMALTGQALGLADCLWCGLATHFVAAADHDNVVDGLTRSAKTERVIGNFARKADEQASTLAAKAEAINRIFAAGSVTEIRCVLAEAPSVEPEWAAQALAAIDRASPTSLGIARRQMQVGGDLDFADCLRTEYRIVNRVLAGDDFYEGVRAQIIDKDRKPGWLPADPGEVTQAMIDSYFAPLATELDLP